MSDADDLATTVRTVLGDGRLVVGVVVIILFVTALSGFLGFTAGESELGGGTATVTVAEPTADTFVVTDGRFGTDARYLRIPDLVATVEKRDGQPRLVYRVRIPELGVDRQETTLITASGRTRVPMDDIAFEEVQPGTYDGRIVVRVQSFTDDTTVLNRSVEVQAP